MAIVKNINSSYTITGGDVIITGNLTVNGQQTAIQTVNTVLKDNIIILNDAESGAGVTLGTAGIMIDRGSLANVTLQWNESVKSWQLSDYTTGTNFTNIVVSSTGLTHLIDDTTPQLGGNLNTSTYSIYSSSNTVNFASNLQLLNQSTAPLSSSGNTAIYAATVGNGQSGIYVVNTTVSAQELITKARSFGYSILF